MTSFRQRLAARYQVINDDGEVTEQPPVEEQPSEDEDVPPPAAKPGETDTQPGSAHPENWQTSLQSGKSTEEIRQDANALSGILLAWQGEVAAAQEYYGELTANSDKYLHMYNPILIKGLSRGKLETIATICTKFAALATIV